MKVMIVDDNPGIRELIRTVLGEEDRKFVECSDGQEAVEAYREELPDWTVMDVAMKSMDGLTATQLIRSKFPGSRIVIVTQHNNPKLRECAQAAGAEGFLLKDDLTELRDLIACPGRSKAGDPQGNQDNILE
jgi:CheY-like chemotaxis protein